MGSRFYLFTGASPSGGRYATVETDKFIDLDLLSLINVKYIISHQPLVDKRLVQIKSGINAMMMNNYDKALLRFKENFTGRKSLFRGLGSDIFLENTSPASTIVWTVR